MKGEIMVGGVVGGGGRVNQGFNTQGRNTSDKKNETVPSSKEPTFTRKKDPKTGIITITFETSPIMPPQALFNTPIAPPPRRGVLNNATYERLSSATTDPAWGDLAQTVDSAMDEINKLKNGETMKYGSTAEGIAVNLVSLYDVICEYNSNQSPPVTTDDNNPLFSSFKETFAEELQEIKETKSLHEKIRFLNQGGKFRIAFDIF